MSEPDDDKADQQVTPDKPGDASGPGLREGEQAPAGEDRPSAGGDDDRDSF